MVTRNKKKMVAKLTAMPMCVYLFSISLPLATNLASRNNLVASLCFNPLLSNSTKIGQNKTKSFIFYVDSSTNSQEQINTGLSLFLSIFSLKKSRQLIWNFYTSFVFTEQAFQLLVSMKVPKSHGYLLCPFSVCACIFHMHMYVLVLYC